jgi:Flp pilus assembly protein TadG
MKKILKSINLRDESGAVLVMVAIAMVALLGFTALTIDGGRLFSEKSQLQNALDAAVLAGAQGLKTSTTEAKTIAIDVATKNGFPITETDLTVTADSIKVTKLVNVPLTFARVLGKSNADVSATSKAVIALLRSASGIAPIAVEEDEIPDGKELTCFNPGEQKGNCGFLALDGSGAKTLEEALRNGSTYTVGTQVETEPGEMWGPVSSAINDLIKADKDKPQCQSADTADSTCERIIYVVVTDTFEDASGRDVINVVGFAAYWIEGFDGKTLIGEFLERFEPGQIGGVDTGTIYGVKLVE